MNREQKIRHYERYVNGLAKCIDRWRIQMSEPEQYGVFNEWETCENNGRGLTNLMDEMVELAREVEPDAVPLWQNIKRSIIDLRIINYNTMKRLHDTPDPPMPTPEEEAAAEAERAEAYRTGGANLVRQKPEPGRPAPNATGD